MPRTTPPSRNAVFNERMGREQLTTLLQGGSFAPIPAVPANDDGGAPTSDLRYYLGVARRMVDAQLARGGVNDDGPRFKADDVSLGQLLEMHLPAPEWIFKNVMNPKSLVVVGAEPKVGKTFHCLNAMLAIAAGGCLYDQPDMPCLKPGAVFAFCMEDELVHVRARVTAMFHGLTEEQRALAARNMRILPRQRANLLDLDDVVELVARVLRHQAVSGAETRAVYLDPFARAFALENENDSREMERAMSMLHLIKDVLGCVVLFVHHAGKGGDGKRGGQSLRGSGNMHSGIEGGLYLRKVNTDGDDLGAVLTVETKNGKPLQPRFVEPELEDDENGYVRRVRWCVEEPSEANGGVPSAGKAKKEHGGRPQERHEHAPRERAPVRRRDTEGVVGPATVRARVVDTLRAAGGVPLSVDGIVMLNPRVPADQVRRAVQALLNEGIAEETVEAILAHGGYQHGIVIAGVKQHAQTNPAPLRAGGG